ncbi:MAG: hypothetical protein GYA58_03580 [Anaerolineaceae bacterium]|nr:hypothetical protein [Anaerolineaceae bacterium]
MFRNLLKLLAEDDAHTIPQLALMLGVSEEIVRMMIADLTRQGCLQTVNSNCDLQCKSCPISKTCTIWRTTKIWAVTKKGYHLINAESDKLNRLHE